MTKEKTKQFNFRIPQHLYDEVKAKADENKITMTDYIIGKLKQEDEEPSEQLDNSYKERYIEQLNKQIEQQEQSIRSKDEHIQELARLLDQQQRLTLATQQDKEKLAIELKETTKNRRKWWQFFGGESE